MRPSTERSLYLPPWRVDVTRHPGTPRVAPIVVLARAIGRALTAAGAPQPASIGLILADDRELAALNATHLGGHGPTDVLSFPLLPPEAFTPHPGAHPPDVTGRSSPAMEFPRPPGLRLHLGDVVVSVERAIDQAETGRGGWTGKRRWTPAEELRLLVTHGALHVCGWDHSDPTEKAAMRRLERELLGAEERDDTRRGRSPAKGDRPRWITRGP